MAGHTWQYVFLGVFERPLLVARDQIEKIADAITELQAHAITSIVASGEEITASRNGAGEVVLAVKVDSENVLPSTDDASKYQVLQIISDSGELGWDWVRAHE